jgi:hypothetical protein
MDFVKGLPPLSHSHHEPSAHHHVPADNLDLFPTSIAPHAMDGDPFSASAPIALAPALSMPFEQPSAAPTTLDTAADADAQPHVFLPDAAPIAPDYQVHDSVMDEFAHHIPPDQDEQRLSAFARLRFNDGSYYMHTYQIILGRNVELAHKDMRRLQKAEDLRKAGDMHGATAIMQGKKRKRGFKHARSVISETGGIVNAPMANMPSEYQQRRQSVSHSASSSSHHNHHAAPKEEEPDQAPQHLLMQAFQEVPEQLDSYVPEDPGDCPLVPIHPQHITAVSGVKGPKGISREHAKIFYDFDEGHFSLEALSSNGLWHEDEFYSRGQVVELNHGDTICIGLVEMTFFLPDIALTEEQRARQDESGSRPMSFSFENGNGEIESEEQMADDSASEDASVNPMHTFYHVPLSGWNSDDDAIGEDDEELDDEDDTATPEHRPRQTVKLKLQKKPRPPTRKELKKAKAKAKKQKQKEKQKAARQQSPDEERPAKRPKMTAKEVRKEPPPPAPREKEKGKAPAKIPAKAPAKAPMKEPPKVSPPKEKPIPAPIAIPAQEAAKTTALESPTGPSIPTVHLRKPNLTANGLPDEADQEGYIDEEMVKKHNLPESLIGMVMEKRKGPGRPPKDGVMSKRQRSQLVKLGKEIEKAKAAGIDPADLPPPVSKPKIARPRKDSNAQPGEGDDDGVRETTETHDALANLGDKKQVKPSKPPRTPSPEARVEDYTEEQLQRPSANYVVLIHEAISSSSTQAMNLQQIYNYIERKYPYYKFRTTTSGWQSSVRHNLGQHDAFVRGDKEGKGFNWKINPEVSIEKERRKRQPTPPQSQRQGYYPPPNGAYPSQYGQPGIPPYYPGMSQGIPNGPPRPAEEPMRRLPPSLQKTMAEQATAPASNPASTNSPYANPASTNSPYASPWAGGNAAGSPPIQNASPYAQPMAQPPPMSSAPTQSSMYGMMVPTSAPQASYGSYTTASTYSSQYATAGASPYGAPPNRPSPYATAGSPKPPPAQPAQPPQPYPPHQQRPVVQPPPPQNQPATSHPSGRYPSSTPSYVVHQLEAFRLVYLRERNEDGEDVKVDHAIQAYVNPERLPTLTDSERSLLASIQQISTLQSRDEGNRPQVKHEGSAEAQSNNASAQAIDDVNSTPAVSAASTAAAIAASDAAVVAASNVPTDASASQPFKRESPITNPQQHHSPYERPAAPAPSSASAPPASVTALASAMEPHKFTPNMMGSAPSPYPPPLPNPIPAPANTLPQVTRVQTQRPSVEPLTPVPGSPAIQHATQNGTPIARTADMAAASSEEVAKKLHGMAVEKSNVHE